MTDINGRGLDTIRSRRGAVLVLLYMLMPLSGATWIWGAGSAGAQSAGGRDGAPEPHPFTLEDVIVRAHDLAARPFDASLASLPAGLDKLDDDHYRRIAFRNDKSFLADRSAFALQLTHLGFAYKRPVVVNIVRDGMVNPIPYSSGLFDTSGNKFPRPFPINLGFAGLRILYPLQAPKRMDELISFLGNTCFRFLGRDGIAGLSARALAIQTGSAEPEQGPFFREMWVRQPAHDGDTIEILGLLDSAFASGAFRFEVSPGRQTLVDVTMTVFARKTLDAVGIAPLSSMFFTGENDRRMMGSDFRPEVHDSDGVLIHNGNDEWVWRPLRNPPTKRMSQFFDTDPRGFGLMQRDRAFDHYADLDARYEQRPSYWVEPQGKWGKGAVDLLEAPASREGAANVALFWRPAAPLAAGDRIDLRYRMSTVRAPDLHALAFTAATFETTPDAGGIGEPAQPSIRRFLVDFRGGDLAYHLGDPSQVKVDASTSVGRILRSTIVPNPNIRGFRVALDVDVEAGRTADLRMILRGNGRPLSETWTYGWTSPPSSPRAKADSAARNP